MKNLLTLLLTIFSLQQASARTGNAVMNSNWNNSSTWNFNGFFSLPACGDTINIPAGMTVTVSNQENFSSCGSGLIINVSGTLQLATGMKLTLPCNSCVNILNGGLLKKSTAGGGNSTNISICSNSIWTASDGPVSGPRSFCDSPLPIQLLRFEANAGSEKVELQWTTASESNNAMFIVERSTDGKEFSEVSKIAGAGNSTEVHEYSLIDVFPVAGLAYYRLKQIDFDGNFSYSDLVAAFIKQKQPFDIISVETTMNSTIKITFTTRVNEFCTFQVLDLSGVPVFNVDMMVNAGINKKEIFCPFLKKGVYLLSISNNEEVLSKKISFLD